MKSLHIHILKAYIYTYDKLTHIFQKICANEITSHTTVMHSLKVGRQITGLWHEILKFIF